MGTSDVLMARSPFAVREAMPKPDCGPRVRLFVDVFGRPTAAPAMTATQVQQLIKALQSFVDEVQSKGAS